MPSYFIERSANAHRNCVQFESFGLVAISRCFKKVNVKFWEQICAAMHAAMATYRNCVQEQIFRTDKDSCERVVIRAMAFRKPAN